MPISRINTDNMALIRGFLPLKDQLTLSSTCRRERDDAIRTIADRRSSVSESTSLFALLLASGKTITWINCTNSSTGYMYPNYGTIKGSAEAAAVYDARANQRGFAIFVGTRDAAREDVVSPLFLMEKSPGCWVMRDTTEDFVRVLGSPYIFGFPYIYENKALDEGSARVIRQIIKRAHPTFNMISWGAYSEREKPFFSNGRLVNFSGKPIERAIRAQRKDSCPWFLVACLVVSIAIIFFDFRSLKNRYV